MKNNCTAKWWTAFAFILTFTTRNAAQVAQQFEELDLSDVTSQFFYPQTFQRSSAPDGSSYDDALSSDEASQFFATFDKACLDPNLYISDFSSLHMEMFETAAVQNCLPIAILDINYHDFIPTVLSDELIYLENDQFFDAQIQSTSPYVEKNALISWIGSEYAMEGTMRFLLKPEWYFTNKSMPNSIQMDFDDGLGFRTVNFNEIITVNYSSESAHIVKVKINRTGNVSKGGSVLKSLSTFDPCGSTTFPFPNTAPWPTNGDPNYPWQIGTVYQGELVKGNAFTLTSDDGVFDKPFVFVEGIDFGYDGALPLPAVMYRNGTFGWCEFSSGFVDPNPDDDRSYGYDMLRLMPDMLNEIRAYGYDIVFVDFNDGADWLQKNSAFVQHVIRLCNQYKTGDEPLIVAGASMGGVLTRHALRTMELNGEDHCARLWLSLDAPHAGANIPFALQAALYFFGENGKSTAWTLYHQMLKRPAALQLLNLQHAWGIDFRNAFYDELDAMGYPEKCRKIGISNGLGTNQGTPHDMFPLIDWECNTFVNDVAEVYLCPNNGDELGFIARLTMPVFGEYAEGSGSWLEDVPILGFFESQVDFEDYTLMAIGDQPNLDYAPGGTRSSIRELGKSLGSAQLDCPIGEHQYNDNHCFVSTASALGIDVADPNVGVLALLEQYPSLRRFDHYIFAQESNERHVELTDYNMDIILEEVLSPDLMELGDELSSAYPNNGSFNFGKEEYTWLRDVHVHNGGQLRIHDNQLTHFAQTGDFLNLESSFYVVTNDCSPSEILIDNDGLIQFGSENLGLNGHLTLNRDSKLTIGAGGTLRLYNDSRIILNEGAEMIIHPDADIRIQGGKIILNPGSQLVVMEGENDFILDGSDARIELNGGVIVLQDGAHLNIFGDDHDCGRVVLKTGLSDVLQNGQDCQFSITGKGSNNTILEVENYARFSNTAWHQGQISIRSGRVYLHEIGAISTDMKFEVKDVQFVSDGLIEQFASPASVQVWGNYTDIQRSDFDRVKVVTHGASVFLASCDFHEKISGFKANGGSYIVKNSVFEDCELYSAALSGTSEVSGSMFYEDDSRLYDGSLVEIVVSKCSFINCRYYGSIEKVGGKLSVSCSTFDTNTGIVGHSSYVNLSTTELAGYNKFESTDHCVKLIDASGINLYKGRNVFTQENAFWVSGTINIPCTKKGGCNRNLNALNNHWGTYASGTLQPIGGGNLPPDQNKFDLHTSDIASCMFYEMPDPCPVYFIDAAPISPSFCPVKIEPSVKSLDIASGKTENTIQSQDSEYQNKDNEIDPMNPFLQTTNFEGVSLDSALVFAATQLESYDSLANDAFAIKMFHEILTSGLDNQNFEIRRKMEWARQHMKTAVERMFYQNELSKVENEEFFQIPVQHYVDVLNLMTDTALTDSTYQAQFYLELDKGQLFRTIGQLQMTKQIFVHLNDCEMDSLEQSVLNSWRQQIELEINKIQEYYLMDVPMDSLSMNVDTTQYDVPITLATSDLYFGLWIESPHSVTFVQCGDNPYYRWLWNEKLALGVYPNPSNGIINITGLYDDTPFAISLFDVTGRKVYSRNNLISTGGTMADVELPQSIASGTYMLRVEGDGVASDMRIVIQK